MIADKLFEQKWTLLDVIMGFTLGNVVRASYYEHGATFWWDITSIILLAIYFAYRGFTYNAPWRNYEFKSRR